MNRDEIDRHVYRLEHEANEMVDLDDDGVRILTECSLRSLGSQMNQLTNLLVSLIQIYNIDQELRNQIARYAEDAIRENQDIELDLVRILKYLRKEDKHESDN